MRRTPFSKGKCALNNDKGWVTWVTLSPGPADCFNVTHKVYTCMHLYWSCYIDPWNVVHGCLPGSPGCLFARDTTLFSFCPCLLQLRVIDASHSSIGRSHHSVICPQVYRREISTTSRPAGLDHWWGYHKTPTQVSCTSYINFVLLFVCTLYGLSSWTLFLSNVWQCVACYMRERTIWGVCNITSIMQSLSWQFNAQQLSTKLVEWYMCTCTCSTCTCYTNSDKRSLSHCRSHIRLIDLHVCPPYYCWVVMLIFSNFAVFFAVSLCWFICIRTSINSTCSCKSFVHLPVTFVALVAKIHACTCTM